MNKDRLNFLRTLEISCREQDVPNITEKNARFLHFLVRMKQAQSVLEIGTAHGYSTIWFVDAVEPFGGHVTTIDHSPPSAANAKESFAGAGVEDQIEFHIGRAQSVLPTLKQKFDVIFVDAIKKSYGEFWELCKPLMKDDTLVIFDDVLKFPHKTAEFHELMESETDYTRIILPTDDDDGIMLVRKKLNQE